MEYDHVQIGFIYNDGDQHNHRWMLNFMDVNNNTLFNYIGDDVQVNCAFTTMSWEDGSWHGRFVVYKKDITQLIEPEEGKFILTGTGDIGNHNLAPLDKDIDSMSLRYNSNTNMWNCDLKSKGEKVGEYPAKTLICDVPFKGSINRSNSKPKVTAELNVKDIAGVSVAMNALIIKKR